MYSASRNTKRVKRMLKVELMELLRVAVLTSGDRLEWQAWLVYRKFQKRKDSEEKEIF